MFVEHTHHNYFLTEHPYAHKVTQIVFAVPAHHNTHPNKKHRLHTTFSNSICAYPKRLLIALSTIYLLLFDSFSINHVISQWKVMNEHAKDATSNCVVPSHENIHFFLLVHRTHATELRSGLRSTPPEKSKEGKIKN